MTNNKWKKRIGIVYTTNPEFQYDTDNAEKQEQETPPPSCQQLRVRMERAGRNGKTATLVAGFIGTQAELSNLAKQLKSKLCTGGSAKNGEIIIQGDRTDEVRKLLKDWGYKNAK